MPLHQLSYGGGRAAGGQHVVDDQNPLPGFDGIGVHLQLVGAIFERILHAHRLGRQFPRLTNRDEADAQRIGDGGGEKISARLNADHRADVLPLVTLMQRVEDVAQRRPVLHQRGNVKKIDPGLGKIGHFANEFF